MTSRRAPDTCNFHCQDLAAWNGLGRMEFEPAAYLADGAEILNHAVCELGDRWDYVSPAARKPLEVRDISIAYPRSHSSERVKTTKIPFGGLVLQMCPDEGVEGTNIVKDGPSSGMLCLHVGIPESVFQALKKSIEDAVSGVILARDPWGPSLRAHDGHHWLYAASVEHAAVYVAGKRTSVSITDMLEEAGKNLLCDAFVTLRMLRLPARHVFSNWQLEMVIKDVLITGSTATRSCSAGEVVGRRKYSSPEVAAAAAARLQEEDGQGEAQPKRRRLIGG